MRLVYDSVPSSFSIVFAIGLAILTLCMLTPAVGQTTNLVVNGSFEANPCTSSTPGQKLGLVGNAVTGWLIPASDGTYPWCLENGVNIYGAGPTPYGNQWLVLGEVGSGVPYTIQQTLAGLTPGSTYKLSFAIASEQGCCSVAEVSFPSGSSTAAQTFTAPASGNFWTAWATKTMNFTATSSSVTLQFKNLVSAQSGGIDLGLDNVDVESTCDLPTGETTAFDGWDTTGLFDGNPNPTMGKWKQTLTSSMGINFSGMTVREVNAGSGIDACWFSGSAFAPATSLSGGSWTVAADNTWGADPLNPDDFVGWKTVAVIYYRTNGRAPCGFTVFQQMTMKCADGSFPKYGSVNTLKGNMTATTVTSVRAGGTATRRY